ncbi:MAG: OmpH family outer membrane protein [Opitutaceae bacterium]
MKKLINTLLCCSLFGATAFMAHADQAPLKIAIVDMNKVFTTHYETIAEQAKLKADSEKAQNDLNQMRKDAQDLYNKYKAAADQVNNPTATADAKTKAQADADQMKQQVQQKINDINQFQNNAREDIQRRILQFRKMILGEISKTVTEVALRHGATLVLDSSGPTTAGIPAVIYSDPSYDITNEVIAEINKNRPANTPAVGSDNAPIAPPSETPKITVPNVTP